MERTINDIVKESNEQGSDSQWTPEQEQEQETVQVCFTETEVVWGKNVRGVRRIHRGH
jgi:hypothetical protein